MGIVSRLRAQSYGPQPAGGSTTQMSAEMVRALGGAPSITGQVVNETTAMRLSAAWSCMRIISESIGVLPWGMTYKLGTSTTNRYASRPVSQAATTRNRRVAPHRATPRQTSSIGKLFISTTSRPAKYPGKIN